MDYDARSSILVRLAWLAGAVCFVLGLHRMNSPATARNGNLLSAGGMAVAIVGDRDPAARPTVRRRRGFNGVGWAIIIVGIAIGGGAGPVHRPDREDDRDAAAGVAVQRGRRRRGRADRDRRLPRARRRAPRSARSTSSTVLDIVIGCVTFTGSLIASGKLQGLIAGKPIMIPGGRLVTDRARARSPSSRRALPVRPATLERARSCSIILAAALIFGVTMVLPIGGADMPVVISLLNSFTGTAVAMAGFVLGNPS